MVKISLGGFALSSFQSIFGADLARGIQQACLHYARRLRSNRKPRPVPELYEPGQDEGPTIPIEVTLSGPVSAELQGEAERQHVSLDRLLHHAALVYLADLDPRSELAPTRVPGPRV
jgi:hypothetical protein